ncbi:glycosyltransferase family 2 protein [Actinomycetospora sp. TBRC 11914]|uniref:glycosyltransferase family 2 protein n=1 Tax=Actinomycetospora sp. TBRC 11914 TaxID=2729387 RepID=UPI00145D8788|nr:glycosyltransferase family 2 protein [Actinomycetospora sp. TBRC 11914]NMO90355.1 glycosyltransferase [Actinomycetospora sp. TBRC 11914]
MTTAPTSAPVSGTWCCEYELSDVAPPRSVVPVDPTQNSARVLVRLHGEPLGYVVVDLVGGTLDVDQLAAAVRRELRGPAAEHLVAEGLPPLVGSGDLAMPAATSSCPSRVDGDELVSVVVCTRDRSDILRHCLESLRELTYPHLDVVVVDNAPTDDRTERVVHEIGAGRFRHVVEPRPGLSCARNRGLAETRGRWIAFTDDDVTVDPHWIEGILRGTRRHDDVGLVTGLVATASVTGAAEAYFDARAASWSVRTRPELFDRGVHRRDDALYPYAAGVFGAGANLTVERDLLLALGGFDEALGAGTPTRGGEDLDAFVRVVNAGRVIAYEPSAVVWHHHRADASALRRQMYAYGTGMAAFVAKFLVDGTTRWDLLRRIPIGLWRMRRIGATTREGLGSAHTAPRGALALEFAGFVAGPWLYGRSRRGRRDARRAGYPAVLSGVLR